MELNPEHEVTRSLHESWHKLLAMLVARAPGKEVWITQDEVLALAEVDMALVVSCDTEKGVGLRLVPMVEAIPIAEEEARKALERKYGGGRVFPNDGRG